MFEAHIDNTQLNNLVKDLELTERQLLNIAKKVFKMRAKILLKRSLNALIANIKYRKRN